MVSMGKAGNVETALQGHGNIHGSGTSNGVPCCIQAGTALHVDNYFDYLCRFIEHPYLWVYIVRTP